MLFIKTLINTYLYSLYNGNQNKRLVIHPTSFPPLSGSISIDFSLKPCQDSESVIISPAVGICLNQVKVRAPNPVNVWELLRDDLFKVEEESTDATA